MRGKSEVDVARKRLDAAFSRVAALTGVDLEVQSDFARYLCVLVSGFIETAISELAIEHCRKRAPGTVSSYAESQLGRLQNLKAERILQLIGSFNPDWRPELEKFIAGERKDAVDSVVELRNKIAHGESIGLTYTRVRDYYKYVREVIDFLAQRLD